MPYWRISAFYFFYFGVLGVLVPYWGPYLKSLGYDPAQIGNLMAITMGTKIVAPNIWGWMADRSGRPMLVVRVAGFLAVVSYIGVFFGTGFWWLALIMTLFTFFWNAAIPQMEATTLNHLGENTARYGHLRLWGSLGFIAAVVAMGPAIDRWGPQLVLPVLLAVLTGIFFASLFVPEKPGIEHQDAGSLWRVLSKPSVLAFLAACFLVQASHSTYYTFYTIYLSDYGYSKAFIGLLWALGVISEIVIFLLIQPLYRRLSMRQVWLASLLLTSLRWIMIGLFPESLSIILAAQVLHAFSFGAYHVTAVHLVHRYFRGRLQHRGQAIYSSLSFGAGGAAGSLAAGYLWQWYGPEAAFMVSAVTAALAFVLAYFYLERSPVAQTG